MVLGLSIPILSYKLPVSELESFIFVEVSVWKLKRFFVPCWVSGLVAGAKVYQLNQIFVLFRGLLFKSFHLDQGLYCIIEFIVVKDERNGLGQVDFGFPSVSINKKCTRWACRATGSIVCSWYQRQGWHFWEQGFWFFRFNFHRAKGSAGHTQFTTEFNPHWRTPLSIASP